MDRDQEGIHGYPGAFGVVSPYCTVLYSHFTVCCAVVRNGVELQAIHGTTKALLPCLLQYCTVHCTSSAALLEACVRRRERAVHGDTVKNYCNTVSTTTRMKTVSVGTQLHVLYSMRSKA